MYSPFGGIGAPFSQFANNNNTAMQPGGSSSGSSNFGMPNTVGMPSWMNMGTSTSPGGMGNPSSGVPFWMQALGITPNSASQINPVTPMGPPLSSSANPSALPLGASATQNTNPFLMPRSQSPLFNNPNSPLFGPPKTATPALPLSGLNGNAYAQALSPDATAQITNSTGYGGMSMSPEQNAVYQWMNSPLNPSNQR